MSHPSSYLCKIAADPLARSHSMGSVMHPSTGAHAAVVYLLIKTETYSVVRFVAAKTRVAPLNGQIIP